MTAINGSSIQIPVVSSPPHFFTDFRANLCKKIKKLDLYAVKEPKRVLITAVALIVLGIVTLPIGIGVLPLIAGSILAGHTAYRHIHIARHILHEDLKIAYRPELNHMTFTPASYNYSGKEAKLEYRQVTPEQQIPVLSFSKGMTNEEKGHAQGYLMGEQLWELLFQVFPLMTKESGKDRKDPTLKRLNANVQQFTFPQEAQEELSGMVKGFKEWAKEKGYQLDSKELLHLLKLAHVLTDTYKGVGSGHVMPGCSTVVMEDDQGDLIVGRNLDWVSIGQLGKKLFFKEYQSANGFKVYSHIFPGFVGGLTCWNDQGLKIIVNELGLTTKPKGTPYSLLVKQLIETCGTVDEVKKKLITWQNDPSTQSASSVSFTVVDKKSASVFQFYPNGNVDHAVGKALGDAAPQGNSVAPLMCIASGLFERLFVRANAPLMTTNHAYGADGKVIDGSKCDGTTECRLEKMKKANLDGGLKNVKLAEKMLTEAGEAATIASYIFAGDNVKIVHDNYSAHNIVSKTGFFSQNF